MTTPSSSLPRWRFLYASRNPGSVIQGDVGNAWGRKLTLRVGPDQNHQATFRVDGSGKVAKNLIELETDIIVLFQSSYVFQGRIAPSVDDLDDAGHFTTFTANDYRDILRRQALQAGDTLSYTTTEQQQIAWGLISSAQGHPGGNLGLTQGIGAAGTGITRTMTFAVGDFIGTDIGNMAALANGFDWAINVYGPGDLRFDCYFPSVGANQGTVLTYPQGRIQSLRRTVDPSSYGNSVYYTGDSSVSLTPQLDVASDIATRPEGRWDLVVGTNLLVQAALNDAATAGLAAGEVLTPTYEVKLQPSSWGGLSDIWIGDNVTLRINSGRLNVNQQVRVVQMDFDIDENNNELVTLTLGAIPLQAWRIIPAMLRRLAYLNTR